SGSRKDYDMLNISQITETVDSLEEHYKNRKVEFTHQMNAKYAFQSMAPDSSAATDEPIERQEATPGSMISCKKILDDEILRNIDRGERPRVIQNALRIARSNKSYYTNAAQEYLWREKLIARHLLEWQKKFSVSFSCFVLFFIGAP